MELSGDEELLKQIEVTQPASDQLLVKGTGEGGGGGITVIQSGGGRRSSISVGNVSGRGVVIDGDLVGGRIVSGGDLVIVNGKVVSGGGAKVTVVEGNEMPKIVVTVPQGTDLEVDDVSSVEARGLCGRVDVSIGGQSKAVVDGAKRAKIRCSGQSDVSFVNISGDLRATSSGQSQISVVGDLGDIDVETSGQSGINIVGSCRDCEAESSGQSHIVVARATGKVRKHSSGQSHISIGQ